MDNFIESISGFLSKLLVAGLITSGVAILAGEIRLAALKKASQGSSRLSNFTQRMTKTSPLLNKGGQNGTRKKSR